MFVATESTCETRKTSSYDIHRACQEKLLKVQEGLQNCRPVGCFIYIIIIICLYICFFGSIYLFIHISFNFDSICLFVSIISLIRFYLLSMLFFVSFVYILYFCLLHYYLSIDLPIDLSICLFVYPSIFLSMVYLSCTYLSNYRIIQLFVRLSVFLSVFLVEYS